MKIKLKGFITYSEGAFDNKELNFNFFSTPMNQYGYITVQPHEIEVEIPDDFDPRPQQVAALEEQKQKARAEFQARVAEIDRQIQSLLAIEVAA